MLSMLNNFEVGKVTLHYILPNLCDKVPPARAKPQFEELIEKLMEIDSSYLFQEIVSRLKQKNSVIILHNLELVHRVLSDKRLLTAEVASR